MARIRTATRLHLLTVKQIQNVGDGDHSDGGGLLLRIRGASASWVFRFTAPTGRRREMGLGVAHRGSGTQAGDSLTAARRQAQETRDQLLQGADPIDARAERRVAAQQIEQAKKATKQREHWTLARAARDGVPGRRHRAEPVHRKRPCRCGRASGRRRAAAVQPVDLAWLHGALCHEPGGLARRIVAVPGASQAPPGQARDPRP